jgi:hypothetical protein
MEHLVLFTLLTKMRYRIISDDAWGSSFAPTLGSIPNVFSQGAQ